MLIGKNKIFKTGFTKELSKTITKLAKISAVQLVMLIVGKK